jgi:hypothetical protein
MNIDYFCDMVAHWQRAKLSSNSPRIESGQFCWLGRVVLRRTPTSYWVTKNTTYNEPKDGSIIMALICMGVKSHRNGNDKGDG